MKMSDPKIKDATATELAAMGRDLRHFIEQSERPDLTHGALQNEPGGQDEPPADT